MDEPVKYFWRKRKALNRSSLCLRPESIHLPTHMPIFFFTPFTMEEVGPLLANIPLIPFALGLINSSSQDLTPFLFPSQQGYSHQHISTSQGLRRAFLSLHAPIQLVPLLQIPPLSRANLFRVTSSLPSPSAHSSITSALPICAHALAQAPVQSDTLAFSPLLLTQLPAVAQLSLTRHLPGSPPITLVTPFQPPSPGHRPLSYEMCPFVLLLFPESLPAKASSSFLPTNPRRWPSYTDMSEVAPVIQISFQPAERRERERHDPPSRGLLGRGTYHLLYWSEGVR